ncbi:MAG: hypothetical protein QXZ43_03595 [Candidatus Aenigmatarchaeota archaeon]
MFVSSGGIQLFTSLLPPGTLIRGEDIGLIVLIIITIIIIALILDEQETGKQKPKK